MEKLPMCRVCLAANVRMYVVVNKNLRELYEKLTENPFVTEDSRPMLACFYCCAKLKQCYQFQRKCLDAEKLVAQMMNEDYDANPLINQDHREFCNGFIQTPIVHVSIAGDGECETESVAEKEELPAVCERLDDIIEPKEEHQSDRAPVAEKPNQHIRRRRLRVKDKAFKCEICQRSFNRNFNLTRHMRTHAGEIPFKCDVCQRCFSEKGNLRSHIRTHTVEKLYEFYKCERRFSHTSVLSQNIRIHTVEKPFKCDICQCSFREKHHLKSHIRTHTGEKPYECDICQRRFNDVNILSKHIRNHAGEKPFKCEVCQRRFSNKYTLKNHIRMHTGEKPYKCDICQRSFNIKGSLTRHASMHTYKSQITRTTL